MGDTSIEWTDTTWNPVRGCAVVSPGCTNCYAMKQAHRFSGAGRPYAGLTKLSRGGPVWTGKVRTVPELLDAPLRWKKPRRIFVNSMSDLFHEDVPWEFIDAVFAVMRASQRHTYQILTKRPKRMLDYLTRNAGERMSAEARSHRRLVADFFHKRDNCGPMWPLPNVWLGVSVEDQARADERIPLLLQTPAAIRWISAEPLLGPVGVSRWLPGTMTAEFKAPPPLLDWIVVGGESGPGARPFDVEWARAIVRQCKAAGVPVFVKQLGSEPRGWCTWNAPEHIGSAESAELRAAGEDAECINYEAHEQAKPCESYGKRCVMLRDRKGGAMEEWPEDLRVREYPT